MIARQEKTAGLSAVGINNSFKHPDEGRLAVNQSTLAFRDRPPRRVPIRPERLASRSQQPRSRLACPPSSADVCTKNG
jgi:hypothetical protein